MEIFAQKTTLSPGEIAAKFPSGVKTGGKKAVEKCSLFICLINKHALSVCFASWIGKKTLYNFISIELLCHLTFGVMMPQLDSR